MPGLLGRQGLGQVTLPWHAGKRGVSRGLRRRQRAWRCCRDSGSPPGWPVCWGAALPGDSPRPSPCPGAQEPAAHASSGEGAAACECLWCKHRWMPGEAQATPQLFESVSKSPGTIHRLKYLNRGRGVSAPLLRPPGSAGSRSAGSQASGKSLFPPTSWNAFA